MRFIALHGAGEGFCAASVVEIGVQENSLKCSNCPVESVFLNMLLNYWETALHETGEALLSLWLWLNIINELWMKGRPPSFIMKNWIHVYMNDCVYTNELWMKGTTHIRAHMYTYYYIYEWICSYMDIYAHMFTYVRMRAHMRTYVCIHVHEWIVLFKRWVLALRLWMNWKNELWMKGDDTYTRAYVHICLHMFIHKHMRAHMHIYAHTCIYEGNLWRQGLSGAPGN